MKKFVRTPWVQSILAWLVSLYLSATLATMRWRFVQREAIDAAVASPDGAIACFWHGRIALAVACRKMLRKKPRQVIISGSPDGEFIAKVVGRLSFPAIRGSTERRDATQAKGGAGAVRAALRLIQSGGVVAITPDGPRGPAQRMSASVASMARTARRPVFVVGLAARPTLTLKSWDRSQIPLPFGRGYAVFDGPFLAPHSADAAQLEAIRAEWEARLNAVHARAEQLAAQG